MILLCKWVDSLCLIVDNGEQQVLLEVTMGFTTQQKFHHLPVQRERKEQAVSALIALLVLEDL